MSYLNYDIIYFRKLQDVKTRGDRAVKCTSLSQYYLAKFEKFGLEVRDPVVLS